ncbi:MAG TPA: hypothetical protein VEK57_28115 [Thermoanaerobaculia bacterium]|nr:hypothetical protein [Thermoanaerobaculia bacterium]
MSNIVISDSAALIGLADNASLHPKGTTIRIDGDLAQTIARTFEAYHRYRSTTFTTAGVGAAAMIGLAFGPAGWIAVGALATFLGTIGAKVNNDNSFKSVPFSREVDAIARAGFKVSRNESSYILLARE